MNLVERYIEAVKFWLPKEMRDDVAAELAEDIRSEIEEAEREKGRKPTDDEVVAIVKARGTPLSVASRYLPQRSLIGPALYPLYIMVLKFVALVCVIPAAIGILVRILDLDAPGFGPFEVFWSSPGSALLYAFAIVTIVFAFIEWQSMRRAKSQDWDPRTLRLASDYTRMGRFGTVGDIVFSLVVLSFFALGYLSQTTYGIPGGHIIFSPDWIVYWQVMAAVVVVAIAASAVDLLRPYWTVPRIFLRFAIHLAWVVGFLWLLQNHPVQEFAADWIPATRSPPSGNIDAGKVGAGMIIPFAIVAIVRLIQVARQRYRLAAAA